MSFTKLLILAALVYAVIYFIYSPYQQCIREFDASVISIDNQDESPDKAQTMKRELLNIAKDGHQDECASNFQW